MQTATADRPRFETVGGDDGEEILVEADAHPDEVMYMAAVMIDPVVINGGLHSRPTKSVKVYVGNGGHYKIQDVGSAPTLVLDEEQPWDYDLISDMHPDRDAHVYLLLTEPYEDEDAELVQEWYRDETYPDTFKEDA